MSETVGRMRQAWALAGATAALAAVGPAAVASAEPAAGAPQAPALSHAEASAQLDQAVAALTGEASQAEPTDELRDLALALPSLSDVERRTAKRVLARPRRASRTGGTSRSEPPGMRLRPRVASATGRQAASSGSTT